MLKILFSTLLLILTTNVYAAGDKFCHFNYQMITNGDAPVNEGVVDDAVNSQGGGAIFFYEISSFVRNGQNYELSIIAQLDCEDSNADKEAFKKAMLENCGSLNMGGVTVPMSEDFDFSQACG